MTSSNSGDPTMMRWLASPRRVLVDPRAVLVLPRHWPPPNRRALGRRVRNRLVESERQPAHTVRQWVHEHAIRLEGDTGPDTRTAPAPQIGRAHV